VDACGVCLTDVHRVDGLFDAADQHIRLADPPQVLGHEYGGTIEALGPGVSELTAGTRVACLAAAGFAERAVVRKERVFPIPDQTPPEEAIFVEPIACCVAAVEKARLPVGCTALIAGAGPMGLILLQLARRSGAARVLVSEPNPDRRAMAERLGADRAIDPREIPLAEAVDLFTRGTGVNAAFDASGHPAALREAIESVAEFGTVVMVGVPPATAHLDLRLYPFHRGNLTLVGSYGAFAHSEVAHAVNWLGQLELASLISHRFTLDDVATAFDVARQGSGRKVVVYPNFPGG
jgi:threonine dehydrogenase-like Zn-dependent dehydrogenase